MQPKKFIFVLRVRKKDASSFYSKGFGTLSLFSALFMEIFLFMIEVIIFSLKLYSKDCILSVFCDWKVY